MGETVLTIAIPTVNERAEMFLDLYDHLLWLIEDRSDIEVIYMMDDKEISIGVKRQMLLDAANGEYFVMIDDDDSVSNTYVSDIMEALKQNPDHVGFIERCDINGVISHSTFSIKDKVWSELPNGDHIRCANPKSVVRTSIARQVGFPDMRYGEDRVYSEGVTALCKTEVFIDKVLYFYNHQSTDFETRYGFDKGPNQPNALQ